jgi:hypothetical protein
VHDAETTAERQVLVKIEARLKPYRKMVPGIPANARPNALKMAEKTKKKIESRAYDKFLDLAIRASKQIEITGTRWFPAGDKRTVSIRHKKIEALS